MKTSNWTKGRSGHVKDSRIGSIGYGLTRLSSDSVMVVVSIQREGTEEQMKIYLTPDEARTLAANLTRTVDSMEKAL